MHELSKKLAQLIGVQPPPGHTWENKEDPETMTDWAVKWANEGLYIFPCARYLGEPMLNDWFKKATCDEDQICEWWGRWPEADIGAVPSKSGHFVVAAFRDEGGIVSLDELEEQHGKLPTEYRYHNNIGDEFLWLSGRAYTSHHRLGRGIHVLGKGHMVFLPASWAPHINYRS